MTNDYPFPEPEARGEKAWLGDAILALAARTYYCAYPRPTFPVSAILSNQCLSVFAKHIGMGKGDTRERATDYEAHVWDLFLDKGFTAVMDEVKRLVEFRASSSFFNLTTSKAGL